MSPRAGRSAASVHVLGGSSDWRRGLLDRAGATIVAIAGTRMLREATRPWPWPALTPEQLADAVTVAGGWEIIGAVAPRQSGRERLSLLGRLTRPRGRTGEIVVKLGRPGDGLDTEAEALQLLTERPLPTIATPRVVARGTTASSAGEISWLVTEPLGLGGGLGRQRPAIDAPLATLERDLAARLADLPRPSDAPIGHVPVHGDLAPWNLRRTDRGLALFDWEAAGWGPPGSDLAHYREACRRLRSRR